MKMEVGFNIDGCDAETAVLSNEHESSPQPVGDPVPVLEMANGVVVKDFRRVHDIWTTEMPDDSDETLKLITALRKYHYLFLEYRPE
jgi:hypothetical protein